MSNSLAVQQLVNQSTSVLFFDIGIFMMEIHQQINQIKIDNSSYSCEKEKSISNPQKPSSAQQ
jgi:hypothetical protein